MRRMRSGVGRSRSTVKPDGTSDNSELGSRTGHGKENVFCRYGHPSRIIHRAAPKVRKNLTGHHNQGQWRYYRCCGTDRSRFRGESRCDARLVAVEPLDNAVWSEVCRLLENPALVIAEYQRRLDTMQPHPRQLELDALARQLAKARRAIG